MEDLYQMIWSNEEKALIEKYRTLIETDVDKAIEKLLEDEYQDPAVRIVLGLCLIQNRPVFLAKDDFTDLIEVSVKSKTTGDYWLLYNVEDYLTNGDFNQLKDRFFEDLKNYYMFDDSTAKKIASLAVRG
jgi:hypothetical protein